MIFYTVLLTFYIQFNSSETIFFLILEEPDYFLSINESQIFFFH